MIVLGAILLIIGLLVGISLLTIVGSVLVVVGAVLWIAGSTGRAVGGRKHYLTSTISELHSVWLRHGGRALCARRAVASKCASLAAS